MRFKHPCGFDAKLFVSETDFFYYYSLVVLHNKEQSVPEVLGDLVAVQRGSE